MDKKDFEKYCKNIELKFNYIKQALTIYDEIMHKVEVEYNIKICHDELIEKYQNEMNLN